MSKQFSIGAMLTTALAALALVFSASAVSAFAALVKSNGSVDAVAREITVIQDVSDALNHTRTSRVWLVQASVYSAYGMFKEAEQALQTARAKLGESRSAFERYRATEKSAQEQPLADAASTSYGRYLSEGLEPLVSALAAGNPQSYINTLRNKTPALDRDFEQAAGAVLDHRKDKAAKLQAAIQADFERSLAWLWVCAGFFAATCIALWWSARRSLVRPLRSMARAIDTVASRDLAAPADAKYPFAPREIAQMQSILQAMRSQLASTVGAIREAAGTVQAASHEISAGNGHLASRTEQQTDHLQQTSRSIQQMAQSLTQTSAAAARVASVAHSAESVATEGGVRVAQSREAIDAIQTSSRKIGDITAIIDAIAFQTNILALNAAVEAARAGEHGRGFAVVASEVRVLAQRSAGSAKEIRRLIDDSLACVGRGVTHVHDAGTIMGSVLEQVKAVAALAAEIRLAMGRQADDVGHAHASLAQLDEMTRQNAHLVENSALAAHSLDQQAHALTQAVNSFRLPPGTPLLSIG